ncbi:MAG: acetylornithine deacetylase, partial [Vulcanimicrobiaceae bacterium]
MELIGWLVHFDTTSTNSNRPLIDGIANYLDLRRVPVELIGSADGSKVNLIATIGPSDARSILVSGHTDVVPADGNAWETDPFVVSVRDGRLYGRGTADMKSFIGLSLAILAPLHSVLSKNSVTLALSFDEEVGCRGAPLMLPHLAERRERLVGCVVGEPTEMRVGTAHKGKVAVRATVTGRSGHSAYPQLGSNAIDAAAELITWLRRRAEREQREGQMDARFDPPYATIQTGVVAGGTSVNIIPERCWFDFEIRSLPGQQSTALIEEFERHFRNGLPDYLNNQPNSPELTIERLSAYPPLLERNHVFVDWARSLACSHEDPITLSFGSEAGLFSSLGIPTVVCGPGSIHRAHIPNEYIELEQL